MDRLDYQQQEEQMQSESIGALAKALCKAQAEMRNPAFDAQNPHFRSKYASLASVREAVMPVLNKHGLALVQWPLSIEGRAGCLNELMHESGESRREVCLLPLEKANAHGAGSCITYARRYSMQSIAGVVADEDDDANASVKTSGAHKPTDVAIQSLTRSRRQIVADTHAQVLSALASGKDFDAYGLCETLEDADEKVALWTLLDSKQRSRIKAQSTAQANTKATI
jgi:hypothetical protein